MRMKLLFVISILIAGHLHSALAENISPAGLWKTIDDQSGKPKALIRISVENNALEGRIEKLFLSVDEDQNPMCTKCEGALKDQKILGMTILSGFKLEGAEYKGGTILDPDNGKTYQSRMSLDDDGKKLVVRGYIGIPLLGRSQIWLREE